jgi:hypothetical protein
MCYITHEQEHWLDPHHTNSGVAKKKTFHTFECFAFKHVPKELITKLDLKGQHIMVFVGYAKNSKVVGYGT